MKIKKILLFIVEGVTDQNSLALVLSKIVQNESVKFHIVSGDITSDRFTTSVNAITKVNDQIKIFLERNPYFKKSDILKVIHLIDTDGAYIADEKIVSGNVDAYFSCNLEHVLHNELNVNNCDKMDYADRFVNYFYGREVEFIDFISDNKFAVKGTLGETWEFIKVDENSLKRFSNFHLFFA